jgi:hypothetical protein
MRVVHSYVAALEELERALVHRSDRYGLDSEEVWDSVKRIASVWWVACLLLLSSCHCQGGTVIAPVIATVIAPVIATGIATVRGDTATAGLPLPG